MTARKSTGGGSRAQPGDKCRNVAKRSTGPDAKCWAETRISAPYSYYRVDQPTVDPRQVKTKVSRSLSLSIPLALSLSLFIPLSPMPSAGQRLGSVLPTHTIGWTNLLWIQDKSKLR